MRNPDQSSMLDYISNLLPVEDHLKKQSREIAAKMGLAGISLSSVEARLIQVLIRLHKPRLIVEIGTLSGLSAQYMAEATAGLRADAEGGTAQIWSLEKNPENQAEIERIFQERSALSGAKMKLILGDARLELPQLSAYGCGRPDMVFIDGKKAAYYDYWLWAKENLVSGGLLIADNVFLSGAVWDQSENSRFSKKQIQTMQKFNSEILQDSGWWASIVPTEEGLLVAIKP